MCSRCESEGIYAALLLVAIIVVIALFYVNPDKNYRPAKDGFSIPTQQDYSAVGCKNVLSPIIERVSDQDIIDKSPPCKVVASDKGMVLKPSEAILKEEDYYAFGCNQINLNNLLNANKTYLSGDDLQIPVTVRNPGTVSFADEHEIVMPKTMKNYETKNYETKSYETKSINLNEMNDSSLVMPGGGGLSDYLGVPCSFIPSDIPLRISDDIDYYYHGNAHIKDSAMIDNYNEPDHYPLTG